MRFQKTDVLVIGSGGAGMRAAIEAAGVAEVTLVSKGPLGRSGASVLAGADVMADGGSLHRLGFENDPGDTPEAWAEEILIEGFGLNEERLVEAYVNGSGQEIGHLVEWGLSVRKVFPRALITTGSSICASLRKGIGERKAAITAMDNCLAVDLLKTNGQVSGALVFDIESGESVAISAKSTVLATGGWHHAYSFNAGPDEATGDGQAMAFRAGAELIDMEMVTFAPNILLAPPRHRGSLWFYILPGQLLNSGGHTFLSWEDPKVAKLALTSEWNKLLFSKASMREVLAGRGSPLGGVFLSMKHLPVNLIDALEEEYSGWRFQGDDFSALMARMRDGYAAEVGPAAEYFEGGIRINARCETSLPGLYAAGECSGGLFGANRVAAATTEMLVQGAIAGREAGRAASSGELLEPDRDEIESAMEAALAPLGRDAGAAVHELRTKLQETAYRYVGVIRSGERVHRAAANLDELNEAWNHLGLETKRRSRNKELCDALELRNMIAVVRASAAAAAERTESRGVHMREDHPVTDNASWRRHIVVRLQGDELDLSFDEVGSSEGLPPDVVPYETAILRAADELERIGRAS